MKLAKGKKIDVTKIFLGISMIVLIILWGYSNSQQKILELYTEGLSQIETISSGVQRISKLELEGTIDQGLIDELFETGRNVFDEEGSSIYFNDNEELLSYSKEYMENLRDFFEITFEFRETSNREKLFSASESNYEIAGRVSKSINNYVIEYNDTVKMLSNCVMINILLIGLMLVKILLDTVAELKRNKEMSKDMFLDTSTGLYNRAKCQEVLKLPLDEKNLRERAVIIFDLNDLKKTNDQLGHRAGDALISSFALQLKEATNISDDEIFVGRYGGDEFMAYLGNVEDREVQDYLKEVDYLINKFNETENKPFKLSCAAGYAITTPSTRSLSMRELFDEADVNMYENKMAMKAKKKAELEAQGIVVAEHVDDRLM